jgi:hypothetical protein
MSTPRFDVAIVGAGPAGASAAILLARAGWSVALIERQRFPRRKVCGECIAASNLALLDALGVGSEVDRLAGAELRRVALLRGSTSVVAALPAADGPNRRFGRALGRERLDSLLVRQAELCGVTLFQPCALQAIEGGAGAFRLCLRGEGSAENELEAALVVAAHGSWEPLPWERAQRREERRPSDLFAFKANFRQTAIAPDLLPVLSFAGGYGGMVVADDGIATLAGCIREDRLGRDREASPGERPATCSRPSCGASAPASPKPCKGPSAPARGSRPDRSVRACGWGRATASFASAMPRARRIRSSARASAWRSSRRSCSPPCWFRSVHGWSMREAPPWPSRRAFASTRAAGGSASPAGCRSRQPLRISRCIRRPRPSPWPLVRAWPGLLTHGARWSGKSRVVPEAAALVAPGGGGGPPRVALGG